MRTLTRLFVVVGLIAAVAGMACAADVQGVLLDRMCSGKIVQNKDMKAAQAHTRDCALMPDCEKSGYGVYTADGKFITFDDAGNKKTVQALKASKAKDNIRVNVSGEVTGSTMKVATVKVL